MDSAKPRLYLQGLLTTLLLLTFIIIPYGATVRSTDSGLACPDWPLCHGQVIPDYKSYPKYLSATEKQKAEMDLLSKQMLKQEENKSTIGQLTKDKDVVEEETHSGAQVYWEFTHRVLGMLIGMVSFAILILVLFGSSIRKYWPLALLTLVIIAVQGILGQRTVVDLLKPIIVSAHLVTALIILAIELLFTWIVVSHTVSITDKTPDGQLDGGWLKLKNSRLAKIRRKFQGASRQGRWGSYLLFGLVFCQIIFGVTISSNYHGMACPKFPACIDGGEWFPKLPGAHLHMTHRILAYLIVIGVGVFAHRAAKSLSSGGRIVLRATAVVVLLQTLLGILNVIYALPHAVTAAHSFGAALLFSLSWILTFDDRRSL